MDALDQISAEAAGLENDQEAAQEAALNPGGEPRQAIDPAIAWGQLPKMFGGILAMAVPELGAVYTDDKCYAWGAAMHLVAEKYEWDAAETMARYGPEIALAMATLPLAIPTVQAIKGAVEKAKKAKPIEGEGLVRKSAVDDHNE